MKRAGLLLLMGALLFGCNTADVKCSSDAPVVALPPDGACACNCPDGVPERVAGEDGDYCADADDGETCCFWQTRDALMFGKCAAHICMVPIKAP